jgi:hypothetical protein
VLRDQGYRARLLILRDQSMLGLIETLVDSDCGIWVRAEWAGLADDLPCSGGNDMVGFVDGRVTSEIGHLGAALGLTALMGTKSARRPVFGWIGQPRQFSHAHGGGVTCATMAITCLVRGTQLRNYGEICDSVPRDASTVMASRPFVSTWMQAPEHRTLEPLRCANLGTASLPIFHSGGLLPEVLDRTVRVAVPSQFAPKGKWGARGLTTKEVLLAKDVSEALVVGLVQLGVTNVFLRTFPPLGCLRASIGLFLGLNRGVGRMRNKRKVKIVDSE